MSLSEPTAEMLALQAQLEGLGDWRAQLDAELADYAATTKRIREITRMHHRSRSDTRHQPAHGAEQLANDRALPAYITRLPRYFPFRATVPTVPIGTYQNLSGGRLCITECGTPGQMWVWARNPADADAATAARPELSFQWVQS